MTKKFDKKLLERHIGGWIGSNTNDGWMYLKFSVSFCPISFGFCTFLSVFSFLMYYCNIYHKKRTDIVQKFRTRLPIKWNFYLSEIKMCSLKPKASLLNIIHLVLVLCFLSSIRNIWSYFLRNSKIPRTFSRLFLHIHSFFLSFIRLVGVQQLTHKFNWEQGWIIHSQYWTRNERKMLVQTIFFGLSWEVKRW